MSFQARRLTGESADEPVAESHLQGEMRRIVEALYRPSVRQLPGLDVGRAYRGAVGDFHYGGDVVDVFFFGGGSTALSVVDITGHGIPAARNAGLAKHALRGYASLGLDARGCVQALNRLCIENSDFEGDEEFFATLFFAIIPPDRRSLNYVSAGHEAAYLFAPLGAQQLPATGPIIGLMDSDAGFDQGTIAIRPGDAIAAFTDGFSEARDEQRRFLGADAVIEILQRHAARSAERQAEAIVDYAYEFASRQLHDDVAALVLKVVA